MDELESIHVKKYDSLLVLVLQVNMTHALLVVFYKCNNSSQDRHVKGTCHCQA